MSHFCHKPTRISAFHTSCTAPSVPLPSHNLQIGTRGPMLQRSMLILRHVRLQRVTSPAQVHIMSMPLFKKRRRADPRQAASFPTGHDHQCAPLAPGHVRLCQVTLIKPTSCAQLNPHRCHLHVSYPLQPRVTCVKTNHAEANWSGSAPFLLPALRTGFSFRSVPMTTS